ncbi:MAG: hypothetical protein U1E62_26370 [Alsobacter sp.]
MEAELPGLKAVGVMGLRKDAWCHYFFRLVLKAESGDWDVVLRGRAIETLIAAGALDGSICSFDGREMPISFRPNAPFEVGGLVSAGRTVTIEVIMPPLKPLFEYGDSADKRILAWRPSGFEAKPRGGGQGIALSGAAFADWARAEAGA